MQNKIVCQICFYKHEGFLGRYIHKKLIHLLNASEILNGACISKQITFILKLLRDETLAGLNHLHFLLFLKHPFKLYTARWGFRYCGEHCHNYWSACGRSGGRERERRTFALARERQLYSFRMHHSNT